MNLYLYTYGLVKQIPKGKISTYGAVARALGDVRASRAVGRMMNQNPDPDCMPCFKIVQSDGHIGGFGRGVDDKIHRLVQDGISIENNQILDFDKVFFNDFNTEYPLKTCRQEQISLSSKIDLTNTVSKDEITYVAGCDVAYSFDDDWKESCGACVIMDYHTHEIIEQQTVFQKIHFPYIPTYLSFREKPFIEALIKKIDHQPSVLLVDGNGILHPFHFGLACHIGILFDIPTIGVAKKLLCGTKRSDNTVIYKGDTLGYAYYANNRVKKPVYISPGYRISLETAVAVIKKMSSYKQPEPLRQAHLLSNRSIRQHQ